MSIKTQMTFRPILATFQRKVTLLELEIISCRKNRVKGMSAHSGQPSGTLFLVGLPSDIRMISQSRALTILRRVDLVATKNPRSTQVLLSHHGIHASLTTYDPEQCGGEDPDFDRAVETGVDISRSSPTAECRPCTPDDYDCRRNKGTFRWKSLDRPS